MRAVTTGQSGGRQNRPDLNSYVLLSFQLTIAGLKTYELPLQDLFWASAFHEMHYEIHTDFINKVHLLKPEQ